MAGMRVDITTLLSSGGRPEAFAATEGTESTHTPPTTLGEKAGFKIPCCHRIITVLASDAYQFAMVGFHNCIENMESPYNHTQILVYVAENTCHS